MSHNSKYYAKKIKKSHQGSIPLTQFGFKISNQASEACVYDNEAVSNQAPEAVSYQAVGVETELHQTPEINQSSDADFKQAPEASESTQSGIDDGQVEDPSQSSHEIFSSEMLIATKIENDPSTLVPPPKKQVKINAKYEWNYDWLYFSSSKNGFLCKYCEIFGPKQVARGVPSPFLTGTVLGDHPVRKLTAHEETQLHKDSLSR
ncbi:hypothetical protein DPMN_171552 [Dreissena polymorpha]|uniref:Uncharacterized protein n=1 Tax=Dreissena polymorpha TaxID=45954 RepID=A0A9D4IFP4_DREPO|nr:hypothetical protein DPMN_171552 [Dreissena polymorpha]